MSNSGVPYGCLELPSCGKYTGYAKHGCRAARCLVAKREYQRVWRSLQPPTPPGFYAQAVTPLAVINLARAKFGSTDGGD